MRYVLLAVLIAVPIAVSGWVFWSGRHPPIDLEKQRARRDEAEHALSGLARTLRARMP